MQSLPDWQHADTLPDGGATNISADEVPDLSTMRGMALGPVNPHQAINMGGQDPPDHDVFVVTRLNSIRHQDAAAKTSGGQQVTDHRGNPSLVREH
jgi:hypothetical protein